MNSFAALTAAQLRILRLGKDRGDHFEPPENASGSSMAALARHRLLARDRETDTWSLTPSGRDVRKQIAAAAERLTRRPANV